jgi:hypothetical protein
MPVAQQVETVLTLSPGAGNPRNSEGSFITLAGGRILFVYTHFTGAAHDDAEAHLAGRFSDDGGRTWSPQDTVVIANPPGFNIMSVSLLRLADGRIALFYLIKESRSSWLVLMRTSEDEAVSWSEPRVCSTRPGLYVMNNDRAVQLDGGRIVLPVAYRTPEDGRGQPEGIIACLLSDDGGRTWRMSRDGRRVAGAWTQEPLVVARTDGSLLMYCRTQLGRQYVCESPDGGESWSELVPSNITSTLSPASMRRIPATGDLLLVWNNVDHPWVGWEELKRSPLNAAISSDDGRTWRCEKTLADDEGYWFCYTAILFVEDHVLLAHSAGGGRGAQRLATQQISRVPLSWLYAPEE